jgi:MoaA/NifB/PqqE/SkfB family radical SAM enzyme
MCNIWQHPTRPEEEISPQLLEKLPSGLGRVNVTGGEPMCRSDIEDIIAILYPKCKLVEISTNGYFTDKIVRIAEKFPRVMIRVSIEGLPKLNDALRGTPDGFDHALRTVLALRHTPVKDYGFSIVIWDRNVEDLLTVYDLCAQLGIEFGNSTMHNSWYFHTTGNKILEVDKAVNAEKAFIRALLCSERSSLKLRVKDWLRAYFNLNILRHLQEMPNLQKACCAGSDLFFIDPWGNVLPCNGSEEKWIMGNLKEQSWEEIWRSPQAEEVRARVKACRRECAFIGTSRFDMLRRPLSPILWIMKNKLNIMLGKDVDYALR